MAARTTVSLPPYSLLIFFAICNDAKFEPRTGDPL